jgi:hypothetical protein
MDHNSQQGSGGNNNEDTEVFSSRLGIPEEAFVRTSKTGRYTPTIHEMDDLLVNGEISYNEARILTFIKLKTVAFRNTDIRLKRKDLQDSLKITQCRLNHAIRSLIDKKYLIEKEDKDHYYFYGLNPITFGGVIVLRSDTESVYRINRSRKPLSILNGVSRRKSDPGYIKKIASWYQKDIEEISKWYRETDLSTRIDSPISALKYTLIKYNLINGLSASRNDLITNLLEGIVAPEHGIKGLVALIQKNPVDSKAITEEMLRAHRTNVDWVTQKPLLGDALTYILIRWDQVKHHYMTNFSHKIDLSPEAVALRKDLADLILSYPTNKPATVTHIKRMGA